MAVVRWSTLFGLSDSLLRDLSLPVILSPEKALRNPGVIEGQWVKKILLIEDADFGSIIRGHGLSTLGALECVLQ